MTFMTKKSNDNSIYKNIYKKNRNWAHFVVIGHYWAIFHHSLKVA